MKPQNNNAEDFQQRMDALVQKIGECESEANALVDICPEEQLTRLLDIDEALLECLKTDG